MFNQVYNKPKLNKETQEVDPCMQKQIVRTCWFACAQSIVSTRDSPFVLTPAPDWQLSQALCKS